MMLEDKLWNTPNGEELGIDNMLDGFLASREYSSKNGSLTGQFVDCITRLAGKELGHKPWNRGKEFER